MTLVTALYYRWFANYSTYTNARMYLASDEQTDDKCPAVHVCWLPIRFRSPQDAFVVFRAYLMLFNVSIGCLRPLVSPVNTRFAMCVNTNERVKDSGT